MCLWVFVGVCGCLWVFRGVCVCLWVFVGVYGCFWVFVGVCGCLWVFVGVCGCLEEGFSVLFFSFIIINLLSCSVFIKLQISMCTTINTIILMTILVLSSVLRSLVILPPSLSSPPPPLISTRKPVREASRRSESDVISGKGRIRVLIGRRRGGSGMEPE